MNRLVLQASHHLIRQVRKLRQVKVCVQTRLGAAQLRVIVSALRLFAATFNKLRAIPLPRKISVLLIVNG